MPDTPQFIIFLAMVLKGLVSPIMPDAINGSYFASPDQPPSSHSELTISPTHVSTPGLSCKPLHFTGNGSKYQGRFSCLPNSALDQSSNTKEATHLRLSISVSPTTGALTVTGLDGTQSKHLYLPSSPSKLNPPALSHLPTP